MTSSDQLSQLWKNRSEQVITDEAVESLSNLLSQSSATLDASIIVGGNEATGLGLRLGYADIDDCGNDLREILRLLGLFPPPPPPVDEPRPIVSVVRGADRFSVLLNLGVLPPEAFDVIGQQRLG